MASLKLLIDIFFLFPVGRYQKMQLILILKCQKNKVKDSDLNLLEFGFQQVNLLPQAANSFGPGAEFAKFKDIL